MKSGTRKSARKSSRRSALSVVTPAGSSTAGDRPFGPRTTDRTCTVVTPIAKGGVACPFPWRLHEMLEFVHKNDMEHIVSWDSKGKAFTVHDSKPFVCHILPRFFSQTKYASFQRQLNLYGFSRKRTETSLSCYYHPCFLREDPDLVRNMVRCKIKGTGKNRQGSPMPTSKTNKGGDSSSINNTKRATTQSPPALELPPVTPIRLVSSSACSSSEDDDDAQSVVTTLVEPHGLKLSTCADLPLVGSSYTSYYVNDDDCDFMAHHLDRTEEEMVFFDGSPFHLLEPERLGSSLMEHDGGAIARPPPQYRSAMAMAPALPYASFLTDGAATPRMKLQPRSSHYYAAGSSSSLGADYVTGANYL